MNVEHAASPYFLRLQLPGQLVEVCFVILYFFFGLFVSFVKLYIFRLGGSFLLLFLVAILIRVAFIGCVDNENDELVRDSRKSISLQS